MKIFVTGAAGYIGSILIPKLLQKGHEVTALDNFMFRQNSLLDCCFDKNLKVIRGDVRNLELVKELAENADYIIPLACYTGAPITNLDPMAATSITRDAIADMLKFIKPEQRIIYPNTNSGYGVGEQGIFCTEKAPLRPISLYGKLKTETEAKILDRGNAVVFRLATVFGSSPKMRLDLLVNDFVYRAFTDRFVVLFEADFKRNYIHVRDVADAFIYAIENFDRMKDNVYNLGLDEANLSKRELCELIQKQIPSFYFTEAGIGEDVDKRDYIVSNEKLLKAGFKAQISIEEGIRDLINTYNILHKSEYYNA
ncbi:MAG: NAD(P)-dependent oxidoreductase [Eubacteriales bacterium]|nr:NAD(P)-dependent oxidoreductase [Eubacteriales bacterium]